MAKKREADKTREKLIGAGTELIRRAGYGPTTVDEICTAAGVTKGAFFHYFASKEALAEACLIQWDCQATAMENSAPFQAVTDPVERVKACMDFYIALFGKPKLLKSCLAGTAVQEVSETHPTLRQAANTCFVNAEKRFKELLDEACRQRRKRLDTGSLAGLWIAAIQGSLILAKASRDEKVIPTNCRHIQTYIMGLLGDAPSR